MANIKLTGNTWDTSGIYDAEQEKTQKQVNADVSELKTALNVIDANLMETEQLNYFSSESGYVNTSGNNAASSAYRRVTYHIQAGMYDNVQVTGANSASSAKNIAFITFIDGSDNRTVATTIQSDDSTVHTEKVAVPSNAVKILVCVGKDYSDSNGYPVVTLFKNGDMQNKAEKESTVVGKCVLPYFLQQKYLNSNGTPNSVTSTGWALYKLDVSNVDEVRICTKGKTNATNTQPVWSIVSTDYANVTGTSETTSTVVAVDTPRNVDLTTLYVNIPPTGKTMFITCGSDYIDSVFEVVVYNYGYFNNYDLLNHFDDSVNGTIKTNIKHTAKIDNYIFSKDIKNTFMMNASILPEHAWDDNNGTYSAITTSQIYELYDALVTAHSDEMSSETIGTASDGVTPIKVYRFTPKHCTSKYKIFRPKIMVNCSTHGWEKSGTETMLMLLKILFDSWDTDPVLEVLRWDVDWVIVPVSNPYGFDNNTRKNYNGVDLNRNYERGWYKRVNDPTSQTYQGESALSEPESTAINALMQTEKPVLGIDFHDFGDSPSKLSWVEAVTSKYDGISIHALHIGQVLLDRVSRQVVKQFDFLSNIDPTTLGTLTSAAPTGRTADAYYDNGASLAYTFEMCGMPTYEPNKKRFDDNHAIMCVEYFANFLANNLEELHRICRTTDVIVVSDDPEPEPDGD